LKLKLTKNLGITILCLAVSTFLAYLFFYFGNKNSVNIALLYILALIVISLHTDGYIYGITASFFCVAAVNIFFTHPFLILDFTSDGYPVTFLGMLAITVITCTITTILKKQKSALDERERKLAETEKERMRANLLRAVSHDLRTPLTSIIGSSSSFLEDYGNMTDTERMELISNINEDANWLLNIVENLLSVTRIRDGSCKVKKTPEIVEEVVSEAITRIRKRYPQLELSVSMPREFLMVPMDATLIEQVLINLLENAFLHSNSKSPVALIIEQQQEYVSFTVRDHGVGIDPAKLPYIFDGTNYHSTADSHRGAGIGLSICHTIITAHEGTISASNHADGAEFNFTLFKEKVEEYHA
jgi:two-component system sensor histidine kinase KdpD